MQNVGQETVGENQKLDKVSGHDLGKSSTPQSTTSSPTKSESDPFSEINPRFMSDCSESEDDDVSEVESFVIDAVADLDDPSEGRIESSKFLLAQDDTESTVDPETHARLEALLEAAGIGKLATGEGKQLADPEVLRRLTSSVSCALDEAAAALTRMRSENPRPQPERTLVEACTDGDVGTVRKLLTEGRSVNETTEEGESLLSLACSAGYYELAQVLLAMHANVEDRGIKGDCTPLMEAASSGYVDIVRLLIHHGADVNAQSTSGNTPLMYACAGGHVDAVKVLLDAGANVEDHNENGHTPLMEAASAGHVGVAAILLERGAGINTHSNEFKESALTLACYKGHLDMVRFLLEAGADQEHKTDEMHTALMEASMDGHVEVARLLLDSGAQVNMPTDSFESPLTLAACGGHVELALLLIERGANIEEVNDEGYTPLMEAAREGHEEMVSVLLSKGANINAQTEETQETALTLACCGGFLEVADFLIKNGADIELGASTPLMEAAQEGHLELVRYLLNNNAKVNTAAQTGDTALTYACENGHTEVARLLIQYGADLEHESEGGRTPLMKACRAGHLCTVKYLLSQKANVNKQTANNDHTPLSLAAAGGHITVVELLLSQSADPFHKLKDNSTMLIEAAKGGHTNVVQLLLDFPHSILMRAEQGTNTQAQQPSPLAQSGLHDVPDAVRALPLDESKTPSIPNHSRNPDPSVVPVSAAKPHLSAPKSLLRKSRIPPNLDPHNVSPSASQQIVNQAGDGKEEACNILDPQFFQRQQIVEELQRVEQELKEKGAVSILEGPLSPTTSNLLASPTTPPGPPPEPLSQGMVCAGGGSPGVFNPSSPALPTLVLHGPSTQTPPQPTPPHQPITTPNEVVQGTAISDRPKAKPAWKGKEGGKNVRKQQAFQAALQQHSHVAQLKHLAHSHEKHLSAFSQHCPPPTAQPDDMLVGLLPGAAGQDPSKSVFTPTHLMSHVQQELENIAPTIHLHHDRPTPQECELLQRRCLDKQAIIDMAKSAKMEELIDGTFDGITLDEVMSDGWKRDAFLAGMEAQRLGQLGQSFQIVRTENDRVQVVPEPSPVQVAPSPSDPNNLQYHLFASVPNATPPSQAGEGYHLPCQMMQELQQITEKAQQHTRFRVEATGPPPPTTCSQTHPPVVPSATTSTTVSTGSSPASFQSNLILKAPPPCKLPNAVSPRVKGAAEGTREQVQTGTQTSPASDAKKPPITVPPPNGKTKKPRFQLQPKATTSPSIHIEPNQSYSIEGQVTSAPPNFCMDVDSATDSNNDTALTLACAGGHEELVELLLSRGANIEHRDKKGFTPLILAATAGHEKVVEILLNHSADMEAQSERTKDTPLSLACSGGRYEVVELLLSRGANKEHRNVSDYTPLSLAASGGYVNIIRLLLSHGAEINSRTGSKLGISPLMLAAMNGHTAAVKLLLDMGSDINAQIETNRNTALTLACFQGRHEVVSLLLDRKANVEHRAKTGLTPLMEAASGGYVEVGRVLLDKGADVNAPPVPSSRDTALTISADKGHCRFVELLLNRAVQVEVKNKKGNSPLWLAANGGHLNVVELLYNANADIDSQDNRKVSCLMAAFRKGHVKVVKWMVNHVTQFPSDQEMTRYISTVNDKDLLEKCQECTKIIRAAKDQQAAKANKNATILLEELYLEKTREESKKAAAARKREKKKKKKLEKKEEKRKLQEENQKNERMSNNDEDEDEPQDDDEDKPEIKRDSVEVAENESPARVGEGEEGDSGIDANSQGSCSSNDVKAAAGRRKEKKKKKGSSLQNVSSLNATSMSAKSEERRAPVTTCTTTLTSSTPGIKSAQKSLEKVSEKQESSSSKLRQTVQIKSKPQQALVFEPTRHPADREDFEATGNENYIPVKGKKINYMTYCEEVINTSNNKSGTSTSPKQGGKRDEGWKEVVRKYLNSPFRSKKVSVPLNAISRVIGRGGSNINAIRSATGALIEVEKQSKGQGERIITLKGSTEATKQANFLINALIKDPDVDILQILPKSAKTIWEKSVNTAKSKPGIKIIPASSQTTTTVSKTTTTTSVIIPSIAPLIPKTTNFSSSSSRVTAPRLVAAAAKRAQMVSSGSSTRTTMSYTSAIMAPGKGGSVVPAKTTSCTVTTTCSTATTTTTSSVNQTFAAKLTDTTAVAVAVVTSAPPTTPTPVSPATPVAVSSPSPVMAPPPPSTTPKSSPPQQPEPAPSPPEDTSSMAAAVSATSEYSLFNDSFTKVAQQSMWGRENDCQKGMNFASVAATGAPTSSSGLPPTSNKYLDTSPPQVDASKAPGYRGGTSVCSPVSKGGSGSVSGVMTTSSTTSVTPSPYYTPSEPPPSYRAPPPPPPNVYSQVPVLDHGAVPFHPGMSRLNPRAPDFSTSIKPPLYQGGAPPYIQQQAPPPAILANISFPLGKYAVARPNGNTRWPYPPTLGGNHFPQGGEVINLNNLASMAQCDPGDLLGPLENGNSPNVSPSSPQPPNGPPEDRKIPRPIGTERAWKYSNLGTSQEVDMTPSSWIMDKLPWPAGANMAAPPPPPPIERHMYRQNPPVPTYSRISTIPDEIHHMMDTASYQGGLDGVGGQYGGGGGGGLSVMHSLPVLAPPYGGGAPGPDLQQQQHSEPAWDQTRLPIQDLPDKQHSWTPKWSH